MRVRSDGRSFVWSIAVAIAVVVSAPGTAQRQSDDPRGIAQQEFALELTDYAALPITGSLKGEGNNAGALARINGMREEPAPSHRFFVNDLTGPLYILDRQTRRTTTYLDLNGRSPHTGVFRRFTFETGLASGFISFEFDPDYAKNGRFYTIHLEDVDPGVPAVPNTAGFPGFVAPAYAPTSPVPTPGADMHEAVLVEWTDSNVGDSSFEGTARELLRVPAGPEPPDGVLAFNPAAQPGDADWRVLYVACGDSATGERRLVRLNPQRLTRSGKNPAHRPDLAAHGSDHRQR
jgi:hypothetical protein